jgi:pimeloyl-ACP methyl ester carboxylesterase
MAKPLMPALDAEQFAVSLDANVTMRGYQGEVSEGTPLVLLHSINAAPSAMEIRPLFEHYRDKRPVMAPDLPGFGLSDRPAVSYSAVQYARWIAQWLKDFKSPPDVVVLSLTGEFCSARHFGARHSRPQPDTDFAYRHGNGKSTFAARRIST